MKEAHEGTEKLILLDKFLIDGQPVSISRDHALFFLKAIELPGGFVIL